MKPALIKIDAAAVVLSATPKKLFELADGELVYVFNLAVNFHGYRRDLRFWLGELEARANRQAPRWGNLQDVISLILPGERQRFHAGDVDQLFQMRPNTRLDYGSELPCQIEQGRGVYDRPTLATFLERRWIGRQGGQNA